MSVTVSIIVPVYNAENVVGRCIESVLNQEYKDFELLLVDDGSTDSSGEVCDVYAARDERIRVFHKENSGVSAARNLALDEARGMYLQFIDSDDWITLDATGLLVRAAQEHDCDLVIADFYRVVGERVSHKGDIEENGVFGREAFAAYMMENPADFYYGVLWNKLYRRELVEKYRLRMDSAISWCEDFMFNLEYIRHAERFFALQVPVYYYVKTKGSLISQGMNITKIIKMKSMVFECYNDFYKDVFDEEDYEKKRLQVYRFLIDAAGDGIVPFSVFPGTKKLGEERSSVWKDGIDGDGILTGFYRERKLLEHYLDAVALHYDLTLYDVKLLLALSEKPGISSYRELADFVHMSRGRLAITLQKLSVRELIRVEEQRGRGLARQTAKADTSGLVRQNVKADTGDPVRQTAKADTGGLVRQIVKTDTGGSNGTADKTADKNSVKIYILPEAEEIINDLETVKQDYNRARFAGFDEAECRQYEILSGRLQENIQDVLRKK